jgi:CubicO group peptidase (beta-lactamase class C family)
VSLFFDIFMKKLLLFFVIHIFSVQKQVDKIVASGMSCHVFPGAALIVGSSAQVLLERYYGFYTYECDVPVSIEAIFDLASISKVVGTTMMTMLLYQDGLLNLDDKVCKYFPLVKETEKETITIKDLMIHVSGFQSDENVENIRVKDNESHAQAVIHHILKLPLLCKPRAQVIYSCLNFYILAAINELVAGETQESFLERRFFGPLGISFKYCLSADDKKRCVPTTPLLQGLVHDPLARFYGLENGTPGNAGLFSTARDLGSFCKMILQRGFCNGRQILKPELVDMMLQCHTLGLNKRRGLGFNILEEYPFSEDHMHDDDFYSYIVGHTGYTGTMVWIDLLRKIYVVFLTNRVYPDEKSSIVPVRKKLIAYLLELF